MKIYIILFKNKKYVFKHVKRIHKFLRMLVGHMVGFG